MNTPLLPAGHAPLARRPAIRAAALALALLTAGCAQLSHVKEGEVVLGNRLMVAVDKPWNQFEYGIGDRRPTWTQDGFTVDALKFYVGVKPGDLIAPTPAEPKGTKALEFKAGMSTQEIVALFEGLYSRGGSAFSLQKITPHNFAGGAGFRFEFTGVRRHDEVKLAGVGWAVVSQGELFAITYVAPQLSFFPRHLASAEAIARSARIR